MSEDFITMTIGKQKNIALIAHDNKKADLIDWCEQNKEILKQHFLCGTGTTARMITDQTGLPVRGYNSGPLGGDQQIGAKIVEGRVDFVIFFSDPLTAQPHDPDVKALLRIAQVYDIPIANKAYRLRVLDRMATSAERMKNLALTAEIIGQAAKECGDAYTNRHKFEHSGPNGGAIQTITMSKDEYKSARQEMMEDDDC